jgi:hypothetical protein
MRSPAIVSTTVLSEDEIARIDELAMARGVTRQVMIDKLFRTGLGAEELRGDLEMGSVELVALAEGDRG